MTDVADAPAISPELKDAYGHGLSEINRLRHELAEVAATMIRAELTERDRQLEAEVFVLVAEEEALAPVIEAARTATAKARQDLADCQAELSELDAKDVSGLGWREQREHRFWIDATRKAAEDLGEQVITAENREREAAESANPILSRLGQIERARAVLASGIADPFGSLAGQQALGFRAYQGFGISAFTPLLDDDISSPLYRPAYDLLMSLLRDTGIGVNIQRHYEEHFAAEKSPVKHTADGVPFVPHGLTPDEAQLIANRTATRQLSNPVPSAREASDWIRRDVSGLPPVTGLPGAPVMP